MDTRDDALPGLRYERDTREFGRVANLSDAVFAIAMTLLVLTLDVPAAGEPLAEALWAGVPQLIAFVLAFALVANIWWAQHKLMGKLALLDRGLIATTLVLLGAVALVPFPTSLVGNTPTEAAAVLPFVGLFVLILVLFLLLYVQAQRAGAWRFPPTPIVYRWVLAFWLLSLGVMAVGLLVGVFVPLAGLAIAALSGTIATVAIEALAPSAYREWRL